MTVEFSVLLWSNTKLNVKSLLINTTVEKYTDNQETCLSGVEYYQTKDLKTEM